MQFTYMHMCKYMYNIVLIHLLCNIRHTYNTFLAMILLIMWLFFWHFEYIILLSSSYRLGTQSVVHKPVPAASPGNWLEKQKFLAPDQWNQNLHLTRCPVESLKFNKHTLKFNKYNLICYFYIYGDKCFHNQRALCFIFCT